MKAISLENTAVFDVVGIMGGGGGRGWRRAMPSGNFMHSYTTKLFLNQLCNQLSFHKYSFCFSTPLSCSPKRMFLSSKEDRERRVHDVKKTIMDIRAR